MSLISRITTRAALLLCLAPALQAQDAWSMNFKMHGGPLQGKAQNLLGGAGYVFGGTFELGYTLASKNTLVFGLGYQFMPGDFQTSTAGVVPTNTSANGNYVYSVRVDKGEGKGLQATALYRMALGNPDWYLQGGLRLGRNELEATATGSIWDVTVTGTAAPKTLTTNSTVTIADRSKATKTSLGLQAGMGYRLNDTYALEVNGWSTELEKPGSDSKRGVALEFAISIRF